MRVVRWLILPLLAAGCSSFTAVRSAQVQPSHTLHAMASLSSPVGDQAGWFYSMDCASSCSTAVAALDLGWDYGLTNSRGTGGTLGVGLAGLTPYVEGYWQIGAGKRPFGIGGRLGIPLSSWNEHRLYARLDMPNRDGSQRFLWNPGITLHTGNSPNGQNPGSIFAITNGFGMESGSDRVRWTPSIAVVTARAGHSSYGQSQGSAWSTFAVAGIGVTYRP